MFHSDTQPVMTMDSSLHLTEAVGLAEMTVNRAVEFCAQKMRLATRESVIECLANGDQSTCGYFRYSLAQQVGECLGEMVQDIRAIYLCEYDATPNDQCFGEKNDLSLVHLIVWSERKTAALESLVAVMDRALVQVVAVLIDADRLANLLDVQIVDDAEVNNRSGYGAMLTSIHNPAVRVWQRQ